MASKEMDELNQLIVVGNGFDIECGLKTTYRDFFFDRYKVLCESGAEFTSIVTPDAKIAIDLGRMVLEATASDQADVVNPEYRIDNIWDVLFCYLYVHQEEIETWKDVESAIYDFVQRDNKALYSLDELIEYEWDCFDILATTGGWDAVYIRYPMEDDEEEEYKSAYALMVERLKARSTCERLTCDNCHRTASCVERCAGMTNDGDFFCQECRNWECAGCVERNLYHDTIVNSNRALESRQPIVSKHELRKVLLSIIKDELVRFESDFHSYVISQVKKAGSDYIGNARVLLEQMVETVFVEDVDSDGMHNAIVSFNYTTPFSMNENGVECINHLHGKVAEAKEEAGIKDKELIFGIDPLQGEDDTHILTKVSRRLGYASFGKYKSDSEGMTLGGFFKKYPIDYVKIYGHSLGDADYSYFQSIFDEVELYGGNTKLCFFGRERGKKPSERYSEVDVEKVYALIERYAASLPDKERGKNLLNKLIFENRLIIENLSRQS